jgi:hypothetical protein
MIIGISEASLYWEPRCGAPFDRSDKIVGPDPEDQAPASDLSRFAECVGDLA